MEAARHEKRAEIKRRIASAERAEANFLELRTAIQKIDLEKEQLASEHVQACQPIQNRLAEIERRQVTLLAGKEPIDPDLEAERAELQEQLREHNAELEKAIAEQDGFRRGLTKEMHPLGKAIADMQQISQLLELGSPELILRLKLAQRAVHFAESRRRAEEDQRAGRQNSQPPKRRRRWKPSHPHSAKLTKSTNK